MESLGDVFVRIFLVGGAAIGTIIGLISGYFLFDGWQKILISGGVGLIVGALLVFLWIHLFIMGKHLF